MPLTTPLPRRTPARPWDPALACFPASSARPFSARWSLSTSDSPSSQGRTQPRGTESKDFLGGAEQDGGPGGTGDESGVFKVEGSGGFSGAREHQLRGATVPLYALPHTAPPQDALPTSVLPALGVQLPGPILRLPKLLLLPDHICLLCRTPRTPHSLSSPLMFVGEEGLICTVRFRLGRDESPLS